MDNTSVYSDAVFKWFSQPSVNTLLDPYRLAQYERQVMANYQQYPMTHKEAFYQMQKGDRVRIKEGYSGEGSIGWYVGKSNDEESKVIVGFPSSSEHEPFVDNILLAAAIKPYPYTREERIERAIEDYEAQYADAIGANSYKLGDGPRAALYAIFDAGI